MNRTHAEALVEAAPSGIDFDGLRVESREDGFAISTPEFGREGLSAGELREAAMEAPAFVGNWYYWRRSLDGLTEAGYAFLRWLERADERGVRARLDDLRDGVVRSWGELAVAARLGEDGRREYDLRHGADLDADRADLDVHDDPLDARGIAKFDDEGRYRPLKGAPTLATGWAIVGLSGPELVRAVDFVYPATVANWHREREGELDVTHWRETAERQTGIYDIVDGLAPEVVARAAEACCTDSACLKRRRWDFDPDTPLDVERGEGEFPCREPCSFLIAAAREWAELEREEPRTYEFELTPSEREQVAEIIDAVAEGRIGGIREADFEDPANRYRARYLRAKRFGDADSDDDGPG